MIALSDQVYGRTSRNLLQETEQTGIEGAHASCESFYNAFNNRNISLLQEIILPHSLAQVNNPLGGIIRGYKDIISLYNRIFKSEARVWVEFSEIAEMGDHNFVLFSGREKGQFESGSQIIDLDIRTSRLFTYDKDSRRWKQIHHHGSIDDSVMMAIYQEAVK